VTSSANKNLSYHRHLEAVAAADVAYVKNKDAKYNASWKQRGGVGAYFTIVRPLDRMHVMLDPTKMSGDQREAPMALWTNSPVPAYDMFAGIAAEGLEGPDGSLIACIRDARRYLMLVEAEMMERVGILFEDHNVRARQPEPAIEPPDLALVHMDFAEIEKRIVAWGQNRGDQRGMDDLYLDVAGALGMTREEAKKKVIAALYGGTDKAGDGSPIDRVRRFAEQYGPGTPDDGGHHAKEPPIPLVVNSFTQYMAMSTPERALYNEHGKNLWRLDEFPNYGDVNKNMTAVRDMYLPSGVDGVAMLDRRCFPDADDYFLPLRLELNGKEHDDLQAEHRILYEHPTGSDHKRVMKSQYREAWGMK
jgi:hypothetical protein